MLTECQVKRYRKQYDRKKQIDKLIASQHTISLEDDIVDIDAYNLKPNKMQEAFIGNIHEMRENGAQRALLISATGDDAIIQTGRKAA